MENHKSVSLNTTIPSSTFQVFPHRVDWLKIAADIKQVGMSYQRQARTIGKPLSTVQRWLHGSEPRHSDGAAFLLLHANVCGYETTQKRLQESVENM